MKSNYTRVSVSQPTHTIPLKPYTERVVAARYIVRALRAAGTPSWYKEKDFVVYDTKDNQSIVVYRSLAEASVSAGNRNRARARLANLSSQSKCSH